MVTVECEYFMNIQEVAQNINVSWMKIHRALRVADKGVFSKRQYFVLPIGTPWTPMGTSRAQAKTKSHDREKNPRTYMLL